LKNSNRKARNKPEKSNKAYNTSALSKVTGIRLQNELFEALQTYADNEHSGNRSAAIAALIEKHLSKYEVAPLCTDHNQRMWRGKQGFYCVVIGCNKAEPFGLKK